MTVPARLWNTSEDLALALIGPVDECRSLRPGDRTIGAELVVLRRVAPVGDAETAQCGGFTLEHVARGVVKRRATIGEVECPVNHSGELAAGDHPIRAHNVVRRGIAPTKHTRGGGAV